MANVASKSYTLRDYNGNWLGQVVLTSDGMFASVTDWGNFSFAWRHYGYGDFRKFLVGLEVGYFGGKMFQDLSYITSTKAARDACNRFAEKILPALQKVLKEEMEKEVTNG